MIRFSSNWSGSARRGALKLASHQRRGVRAAPRATLRVPRVARAHRPQVRRLRRRGKSRGAALSETAMAARSGPDFGDDGVDEVDGRFRSLLQSRDPMRTTRRA